MPYRALGSWVQVFKGGQWQNYTRADSAEKAKAMATAMNLAMKDEKDKSKKKGV